MPPRPDPDFTWRQYLLLMTIAGLIGVGPYLWVSGELTLIKLIVSVSGWDVGSVIALLVWQRAGSPDPLLMSRDHRLLLAATVAVFAAGCLPAVLLGGSH